MGMPSVIVYGPQGCGKSLNAEKLRRAFGCDRIEHEAPARIYKMLMSEPSVIKARSTLYLTHEPPPAYVAAEHSRRVLSFDVALQMAEAGEAAVARNKRMPAVQS